MAKRVSGMDKLKLFLLGKVGEVVTGDQLMAVSGLKTYGRRVRSLRGEFGWPIESVNDASDLRPDEYRLTGQPPDKPPPSFSRRISQKQRARILQRNGSICRMCGIAAGELYEDGKRARLQVDHIKQKEDGGDESDENLRTLCHRCNEGGNRVLTPPSETLVRLKGQVRNTSAANQREIYNWLKTKLGD